MVRFQPLHPFYKEGGCLTALPSASPETITWTTLEPIWEAISGTLTANNIVGIIAGAAGACVALVFLWWAARKVTKMIMGAFRKGRLSV